jgi:hypothetical protein
VNKAIESATKGFNDPKIRYIDINPAFGDHRFCETNHTLEEQFEYVQSLPYALLKANKLQQKRQSLDLESAES